MSAYIQGIFCSDSTAERLGKFVAALSAAGCGDEALKKELDHLAVVAGLEEASCTLERLRGAVEFFFPAGGGSVEVCRLLGTRLPPCV